MGRIRYLKPDFFKDDDLAEKPFWIRLLYAGLWNIADKEGRLEDRPKRIKVDLFPYDNVDIEKGLCALNEPKNSGRPYIQRYKINNEHYIQILKWHDHQKPHHTEKESVLPPAPPLYGKGNGEPTQSELEDKHLLNNGEKSVKDKQIPPTIEAVRSYCKERNNGINAETFVDFYTARGWMIGKNKMKDWRAAIRTWEQRRKEEQPVIPKMRVISQPFITPIDPKEKAKVAALIHETARKMK